MERPAAAGRRPFHWKKSLSELSLGEKLSSEPLSQFATSCSIVTKCQIYLGNSYAANKNHFAIITPSYVASCQYYTNIYNNYSLR